MKLFNLARVTSATVGTGTLTLGSAVAGYLTFALAGVADGDVVLYGIKDGSASEVGWGTYTASGTTLSRNVFKSTNANALISASGSQEVYISALASDGGDLLPGSSNPLRGFDAPINLQVNCAVASPKLTVSLKGNNGADPSVTNPVMIPFRDPTIASGDPIWRAITAAISVDTNAAGATLATANAVPCAMYLVAVDDAGTVKLALWQSVTGAATPTAIAPLDEGNVCTTVAFSASATAAGTFYSQNGVAVATSKAFRVLARLEWNAGLATAGTYGIVPTKIVLAYPGMKRPGDLVQHATMTTATAVSVTNSTTITSSNVTKAIAPTAAPNLVRASWHGSVSSASNVSSAGSVKSWIYRGATQIAASGHSAENGNVSVIMAVPASASVYDAPGTTASTTYTVKFANGAANASETAALPGTPGTTTVTDNAYMILEEIQV